MAIVQQPVGQITPIRPLLGKSPHMHQMVRCWTTWGRIFHGDNGIEVIVAGLVVFVIGGSYFQNGNN
jgi:hypothetical protein